MGEFGQGVHWVMEFAESKQLEISEGAIFDAELVERSEPIFNSEHRALVKQLCVYLDFVSDRDARRLGEVDSAV